MVRFQIVAVAVSLAACGSSSSTAAPPGGGAGAAPATAGSSTPESSDEEQSDNEFQLREDESAEFAHGDHPSEIEATETHAAMRLFVVHPEHGPIPGIVIKMTGPDGSAFYTGETDSQGYAEVLVPTGQRYEMEYLSLGRRNTTATVNVAEGPRQDIRLTMRYRRWEPPPAPEPASPGEPPPPAPEPEPFVLEGILFETNSATIDPESYPRLDRLVEYLEHKPSARVRVAGHTDNVGNPRANQRLSEARAQAVRQYVVERGVADSRIEAVGLGDTQPVASNDTPDGRRRNRRIEAIEL